MSSNKGLCLLLTAFLFGSAASAAPLTCPSVLQAGTNTYSLDNASLFDGPPDQMADLVPDPAGAMDRWNLDAVDPYLVCRFFGTNQTIIFHALGAKDCEAGGKPFQAFCQS
jgi:hypothetical protein